MDERTVIGNYECSAYIGTAGENGYHHVKIVPLQKQQQQQDNSSSSCGVSSSSSSSYQWINRAGVRWTLTSSSRDADFLSVGSDCPYYVSAGYTKCKIVRARDGSVTALLGPFNERYDKKSTTMTRGTTTTYRRQCRPPLILPSLSTLPEWKTQENQRRHAMILPLKGTTTGSSPITTPDNDDWGDLAFLAAIPATASCCGNNNGRRPTVLVPDLDSDENDDALQEFLIRYQPTDLTIFHSNAIQIDCSCCVEEESRQSGGSSGMGASTTRIRHAVWEDLHSFTVCLAEEFWLTRNPLDDSSSKPSPATTTTATLTSCCRYIVAVTPDDYAAVLLASSVAARILAPLFFVEKASGWNDTVLETIRILNPSQVIFVGKHNDENTVADWVGELSQGMADDGVIQPPISIATASDAISWLISRGFDVNYLAIVNPADRAAADESSCTSRKLSLTGPVYAARHAGLVVPIEDVPISSKNSPERLRRALEATRRAVEACPHPPQHVALVGGFDNVPTCQTDSDCNNSKIYAVTDIPYGQLNGDDCRSKRFREIAIGRIYAESLSYGTLLAARTVNYALLLDGNWDSKIVESGTWGFPELKSLFQAAGVDGNPLHLLKQDICKARVVETAAFLHKDHSSSVGLGNFVAAHSKTLYTPAVVVSRGCHAAGIDEGNPWDGTVSGKMLGRGCVSFVGAPRSPTTENTLTEVAFIHELLYSGEANMSVERRAMRSSFNKAIVHYLDGGKMNSYCLENEILLGDPGLVPCFANAGISRQVDSSRRASVVTPASATVDEGGIVTVIGPNSWTRTPIHRDQLKEWKYKGKLFTYVAPLVEQETIWCRKGYDHQELYHVVSVDLPAGVGFKNVIPLDAIEQHGGSSSQVICECGSGWTKRWFASERHHLQHHWDGSLTVRWRLRLLEYDMETGEIKAELKRARFRLVLD